MPTKPEATPEEAEYEVTVSLLTTQQSSADAIRDFLLSMSYDQDTIAATVRNTATGEVFNGSLEDLAAQDDIEVTTAAAPRVIPAVEPTAEQWAILDTIHEPYPKASSNGDIAVYEIKDDSSVALYTIKPDGSYLVEALLNGLHHGWTTLDAEGYPLEYDHDTEEMIRVSDTPVPDWDDYFGRTLYSLPAEEQARALQAAILGTPSKQSKVRQAITSAQALLDGSDMSPSRDHEREGRS